MLPNGDGGKRQNTQHFAQVVLYEAFKKAQREARSHIDRLTQLAVEHGLGFTEPEVTAMYRKVAHTPPVAGAWKPEYEPLRQRLKVHGPAISYLVAVAWPHSLPRPRSTMETAEAVV